MHGPFPSPPPTPTHTLPIPCYALRARSAHLAYGPHCPCCPPTPLMAPPLAPLFPSVLPFSWPHGPQGRTLLTPTPTPTPTYTLPMGPFLWPHGLPPPPLAPLAPLAPLFPPVRLFSWPHGPEGRTAPWLRPSRPHCFSWPQGLMAPWLHGPMAPGPWTLSAEFKGPECTACSALPARTALLMAPWSPRARGSMAPWSHGPTLSAEFKGPQYKPAPSAGSALPALPARTASHGLKGSWPHGCMVCPCCPPTPSMAPSARTPPHPHPDSHPPMAPFLGHGPQGRTPSPPPRLPHTPCPWVPSYGSMGCRPLRLLRLLRLLRSSRPYGSSHGPMVRKALMAP